MSPIRLTGLATGLDVDTLVKQMMNAEKIKVDKLTQDRQVVQWRQDLYRELIGELNTFKSTYFDVLKPENYMLSTRNYSSFDITSTLKGAATTAVTATAGADAKAGIYKVLVEKLAQKASIQSPVKINMKEAAGTVAFPIKITSENDKLTVDGKDIALTQRVYGSLDELAGEINSKLTSTKDSSNISLGESYKAVVRGGKINLDKVIKIDKEKLNNNKFTLQLNEDTSFDVEIGDGKYSLGEIANIINSKLSSLEKDGEKIPEGYKAEMIEATEDSKNIQQIVLKDADGNVVTDSAIKFSNENSASIDMITVGSEQPISSDKLVSKPLVSGNKLEYKKTFLKDVNDTLTVSVGGSTPVNISLSNILDDISYKTKDKDGKDIIITDINEIPDEAVTDHIASKLTTLFQDKDIDVAVEKSIKGNLLFKSSGAQTVTLSGNAASALGLPRSFSIDQSVNDKMSNLFAGDNRKVKFTINNVNFEYDFAGSDKNRSIADILSDISAKANVDITYSQLSRQFTMKSKTTGASQSLIAFDSDAEGSSNKFLNTLFGASKINTSYENVKGKFDFTLPQTIADGDTIKIGNQEYKAVSGTPAARSNEFKIDGDLNKTAVNLMSKINGNSNEIYTASEGADGKIILTQKTSDEAVTPKIELAHSGTGTIDNLTINTISPAIAVTTGGSIQKGEDAKVTITNPDGESETIYKNSNNFALDGVSYTLNNITEGEEVTVTLTSNPQKTFDKIKELVDKYNEIIDKINTKLFEKKQYDYKPLTDEQKKDMSEDDIKKWEEKAKQGLLANDSMLSNMLYSMRNAFFEPVKDSSGKSIGISLSEIGITSSNDYSQRGKLVIDEAKLKEALQNKGDKVAELFTKRSTSEPSYSPNLSSTGRKTRTSEEGIFQRISDILQDNLRTLRDNNGKKGLLLEKAGIKGDLSEFKNLLTEDLQRKDKAIKEMNIKLAEKENRYYLQFSKLESAMQKLNDQSNWLYQQLGMGGNN